MPIQAPPWTEFLSCPVCCHKFNSELREPVSLGCGHTVCRGCLGELKRNQCPYDQTQMQLPLDQLPVNAALLSLITDDCNVRPKSENHNERKTPMGIALHEATSYFHAVRCLKDLASLLKPVSNFTMNGTVVPVLSRPMQRKLVTLINCQLVEDEGRARAVRAARSLGERTVMELILHHQNHHQLSANLWAAVRSRGCQFLGPAMQEEVLKLVLLALEDGSSLSRKVLVMFVVQRLEPHFPQASKTSIGHVVQLLYRASCFKVSKRDRDSSLMQLKEEFRTYESLRREHDAQIVQIATEAGLRIAPDQWSSLLYGDTTRKSHMQSIIDKLQSPQAFGQSVQELIIALQRTGDPGQLSTLRHDFELLASTDPSVEAAVPTWDLCANVIKSVLNVVKGLVQFVQDHGSRKSFDQHHMHEAKYKTSLCRDFLHKGTCPRHHDCTFAHSEDELEKFRCKARKHGKTSHQSVKHENMSDAEHNSNFYQPIGQRFKNNTSVPLILSEMVAPPLMPFVPKTQSLPVPNSKPPPHYLYSDVGYSNPPIMTPIPHHDKTEIYNQFPDYDYSRIQPSYMVPGHEYGRSTPKQHPMSHSMNQWSNKKSLNEEPSSIQTPVEDNTASSLSQLRNRKDKILSRLQDLVGEEEMNEVTSKVEKGEILSPDSANYFTDYPSIYNIWTTGANLSNFTWKKSLSKVLEPSNEVFENNSAHLLPCDVSPPAVVPPRQHYSSINPIQVSAASQIDPVTIPSSHKQLPMSPVQQILYKPAAYAVGFVSYPPKMEYLNTVGHGIVDPPHLHMSQLDPLGIRPTEPVAEPMNIDQEEGQRLHLIAAKEGIDTSHIEEKLQELLLKEELNQIVQQIWKEEKRDDDEC